MTLSVLFSLFHILILIPVCSYGFYLISMKKAPIQIVFFVFAIVGDLLSSLYWITYDILRPETRMPFAANELSEWAMFLLLGASLSVTKKTETKKPRGLILLGLLFSAANTALWIGWSGEWFQDIVTGIVFGYYLCCMLIRFEQNGFLPVKKLTAVASYAFLLITVQALTFCTPKPVSGYLDRAGYVIMFGGILILFLRLVTLIRRKATPSDLLTFTHGIFSWVVVCMYMSSEPYYNWIFSVMLICIPMMLYFLKKEADLQ